MASQPTLVLNDGTVIPQLGFGVWQVPDEEAPAVVGKALDAGYRLIDSAAIYGNEAGVGRALKETSVPRDEIFVTTKLWNGDQGYESTLAAFDASMARLGLDVLDLYLIHWPVPSQDLYLDTWKAMVRLREEGRIRAIGVSNFQPAHLKRIIDATGVTPAVNQVELHPLFQQRQLRTTHAELNIATESWSPLGRGKLFENEIVASIAAKHGKTGAQVILRWHLDIGCIVIPKSVTPKRIAENLDVFDFVLDEEDLDRLTTLDDPAGRCGPDPDAFG